MLRPAIIYMACCIIEVASFCESRAWRPGFLGNHILGESHARYKNLIYHVHSCVLYKIAPYVCLYSRGLLYRFSYPLVFCRIVLAVDNLFYRSLFKVYDYPYLYEMNFHCSFDLLRQTWSRGNKYDEWLLCCLQVINEWVFLSGVYWSCNTRCVLNTSKLMVSPYIT